MAKRFMYVCLGVLALVIAYHLGAQVQVAQSQEGERAMLMGVNDTPMFAMTDAGNINETYDGSEWHLWSTWPGDAPVCAGVAPGGSKPTTWGRIKAEFGE